MSDLFLVPKKIITGEGALVSAGAYMKDFGQKALIVTDGTMVKLGNVEKLKDVLNSCGVAYTVYDKINSEPTDKMVKEGIEVYKAEKCDFLVGLGGGSPIDTMKAIGAMITNAGEINDYLGKELLEETPPLVAVPTTAGTGSEATQFTIITDTVKNVKMLLKGPNLIPDLAVIDPIFSMTAPQKVTVATGLDALTHAIEAYTSKKAQPMSDTFAVSAVKRIFKFLPRAYANGKDTEARKQMTIAALEGGIAFNNSSVTLVHGMSRPIGALFHVPHGMSNAMLLPLCLKTALTGAADRFRDLAIAVGVYKGGMTDIEAGEAFIGEVEQLCKGLNVDSIKAYVSDRDRYFDSIDKMAEDAMASGSPANTRRKISKKDIVDIYEKLWGEQ